ncbi:unnamed protein product [Blepharisma stoltei]|uniref:Ion transport domain-containing protein n=1 Tax=Blepharisma stoltei TaxID=1481888 RepID=A0AAU9K5J0_9CILI|nr:unnamed protein product [Blepharisma stoltei]
MSTRKDIGLYSPSDVLSTNQLLKTRQNHCKLCMNRAYFSKYTRVGYIIVIILCAIGIVWTLLSHGQFPDNMWFWLLEGLVTVLIAFEVCVRMYIQNCHAYWKSLSNIFDLIVVIVCIVAISIGLWDSDIDEDIGGITGEVLMILRTILQFLRVIVFLKNQQKAQLTALKMIDFSQLAEAKDNSHIKLNENNKPPPVTEENEERFNFMRHSDTDIFHAKTMHKLDLSTDSQVLKE